MNVLESNEACLFGLEVIGSFYQTTERAAFCAEQDGQAMNGPEGMAQRGGSWVVAFPRHHTVNEWIVTL